jgi:1,4-dihydroxy-2-naphthoyl-CoA hydrolase
VEPQPALSPRPGRFEDLLGLELSALDAELAQGSVRVREQLCDGAGALHGGVFAAVAQSLVARASAEALAAEGRRAVGLSNQTSFLRAVAEGSIYAIARRRHRGRTTWVWEVEMTDAEGELCALSRVTVAVAG